MPNAILAVYADPADPAREDEFNAWYTDVHIPEVLALEGVVGATRYRLADAQLGRAGDHRYVTIYELDAPDLQAVLDGLMAGFGSGAVTMSDAMAPGPLVVWEQLSSTPP
jgi:hypothetical protein